MPNTHVSVTTNWFEVTDSEALENIVEAYKTGTQFRVANHGEAVRLHHDEDQGYRITMYENVNASLTYYSVEADDEVVLTTQIRGLLDEDSVLRVTTVRWSDGEVGLEEFVGTRSGSETMYLLDWRDECADRLKVNAEFIST